jgi:hypothetical protein
MLRAVWSLLALGLFAASPPWLTLAPGVEYRRLDLGAPAGGGDGLVDVVRLDPRVAQLELALATEQQQGPRTAGAWADKHGFVATINAGMYQRDLRSNVGYLRHGAHLNQRAWKATFQSVLVFSPREPGLPGMALLDRDEPGFAEQVGRYDHVVQNLRLIRAPGQGVWKPNGRAWSESLVAQDDAGHILFVFSRTPYEMSDLVARLLASPLGLVRAMHVEGGPEASLSIRSSALTLDRAGVYEAGFFPARGAVQWPIPNVLGVR